MFNSSMQRGIIFFELLIALVLLTVIMDVGMQYLFLTHQYQQKLYEQFQHHLTSLSEKERLTQPKSNER